MRQPGANIHMTLNTTSPAANDERCHEPVDIELIYGDTPTVDCSSPCESPDEWHLWQPLTLLISWPYILMDAPWKLWSHTWLSSRYNPSLCKVHCSFEHGGDHFNDILNFNEILHLLELPWQFMEICRNIVILWTTKTQIQGIQMINFNDGSISSDTLTQVIKDDSVSCAIYGEKHNLINLPVCRRVEYIATSWESLSS